MYYIVQSRFLSFSRKYPMGILWVRYGYPMVRGGNSQVNGRKEGGKKRGNRAKNIKKTLRVLHI